jgi:hypothetical protein
MRAIFPCSSPAQEPTFPVGAPTSSMPARLAALLNQSGLPQIILRMGMVGRFRSTQLSTLDELWVEGSSR